MKKTRDYLITIIGLLILSIGIYFIKTIDVPTGIMKTLPYLCVGIGCGIFGNGLGNIYSNRLYKNNSDIALEVQINKEDERNITIQNMAKAKGYTMMTYVFSAMILAFALMNESIEITLTLVVVYLFIHIYTVYYRIQLEKKM
ncbi:MAG: DUF6442 family protein [Coprobacillus sp.]